MDRAQARILHRRADRRVIPAIRRAAVVILDPANQKAKATPANQSVSQALVAIRVLRALRLLIRQDRPPILSPATRRVPTPANRARTAPSVAATHRVQVHRIPNRPSRDRTQANLIVTRAVHQQATLDPIPATRNRIQEASRLAATVIQNPAIPIPNPHRSQIPKATRNQDRLANPEANQVIHVTRPAVDRIRTADQDPAAYRSQQVSLKANQTARQHRGPAAIRNRTPQANQVSPAHHQPANLTTAPDPTLVLPAFRILIRKANQHLTREANPTPAAGRDSGSTSESTSTSGSDRPSHSDDPSVGASGSGSQPPSESEPSTSGSNRPSDSGDESSDRPSESRSESSEGSERPSHSVSDSEPPSENSSGSSEPCNSTWIWSCGWELVESDCEEPGEPPTSSGAFDGQVAEMSA